LAHRRAILFFLARACPVGEPDLCCAGCDGLLATDLFTEINDPAPHDAVNRRDRAALDDRGQRGSMRVAPS
jgi:hypothetical protein